MSCAERGSSRQEDPEKPTSFALNLCKASEVMLADITFAEDMFDGFCVLREFLGATELF